MKRKMYKFLNSLTLPLGGHVYHLQWYMHFIPGEPWLISLQGRISSAVAYALLLLFLVSINRWLEQSRSCPTCRKSTSKATVLFFDTTNLDISCNENDIESLKVQYVGVVNLFIIF